jgi:hypothetical protein
MLFDRLPLLPIKSCFSYAPGPGVCFYEDNSLSLELWPKTAEGECSLISLRLASL